MLKLMLKLIASLNDRLVEEFRTQWDCYIDNTAMASDFTMINLLKGISRAENWVRRGSKGECRFKSDETESVTVKHALWKDMVARKLGLVFYSIVLHALNENVSKQAPLRLLDHTIIEYSFRSAILDRD